jgi:hypothetical protein
MSLWLGAGSIVLFPAQVRQVFFVFAETFEHIGVRQKFGQKNPFFQTEPRSPGDSQSICTRNGGPTGDKPRESRE